MPKWTNEQALAIEKEGTNIIVSAGAGSGKTAVLTARVLRKLKSGININNLLILTFTKAAAQEMKERIRKNIKKEPELKNQLDNIDASYITTFDSYALSVVKKYHYLLNVSQNVSIVEESVISLKKEEIIDNIFDNLYIENNEKFLKLINDFCTKDDTDIKNYIIDISNKLDMKYDKKEYLENYLLNNFNESKINNDINEYVNIIKTKKDIIEEQLKILEHYIDNDYYNNLYDLLLHLLNSNTYEEIKNNLITKLPNLPKNTLEEAKKTKNNISSILKEINELCCYSNTKEIYESILSTKDYVDIICEIILKLDDEINSFKYKSDVFEFNDIAKMAIRILKENPEIKDELKCYFNEIMVDEYQDTNDLQEIFISLIANNNVYMVGDIKQSIYRFRNANPYIFKSKYDKYSKNDNGFKIDLNKNFRSRKEVLSNINLIFDLVMDDFIGGADYKTSHEMVFGNQTYDIEGNTNQNNDFEVFNYTFDKEQGYLKEEIEAFIIANDIKNKIDNHYQVFDKDNLVKRNIEYSDFVILMDRTTNFNLYKKIFEYMNIPLNVYKDEIINNGFDIYVIRNILRLIKMVKNNIFDEDYKYCFTSIARSFLFNYSDDEILTIIKNNGYRDTVILEKINNIIDNYNVINSSKLLDIIIDTFDFYNKLISIGNIEQAMVRLEYLNTLSLNLSDIGYDIDDFIDFIDNIVVKQKNIKYNTNNTDSNGVKIMTIHKSKGLEYHICYYSGLYAKFNISDLNEKFTYDNKYGIITPYINDGMYNTIYKVLLKNKYIKDEISEKIRLFYVALTRAKEKMILVTPLDSSDEYLKNSDGVINDLSRLNYSSFDDILKSIKDDILKYFINIDLKDIPLSHDYNFIKDNNFLDSIPNNDELIEVNEINILNNTVENLRFSKSTNELMSKNEKSNMKIGKDIHYILETVDFKKPNLDGINDFYKNKIIKFLDCLGNIDDYKIYKEYEFVDNIDNINYHGIIDLMLESDDLIKIFDYKLKNINDDGYVKQLSGYKKYIEKKTKKKVNIYLYSILDEIIEEIKV